MLQKCVSENARIAQDQAEYQMRYNELVSHYDDVKGRHIATEKAIRERQAKGQVTIPKDVRSVLGLDSGSRVTFIVEKGSVRMVNSAVYAMQMLQNEMAGEAERTGLTSEEAVNDLVKEIRSEGE